VVIDPISAILTISKMVIPSTSFEVDIIPLYDVKVNGLTVVYPE
jgi:hypothetical protein